MRQSEKTAIQKKILSNNMKFRDALKTASLGIRHARVRSLLTMLGIVIGIASVILLMSVGRSAQELIIKEVEGIGSNLIFVHPGATRGSRFSSPPSVQGVVIKTLTERDALALRREPSVSRVAPEVRGRARVIFENNDLETTFEGTNADFFTVRNFKVERGNPFTVTDVQSFRRVAVIGSELAETLFGLRDPIAKQIRLKGIAFTIIGVLEEKGVGPFGIDQDNLIIIPITIAQKQLLGIDYYNDLSIQANADYTIDFVKTRITAVLRSSHGITNPDKDDFSIHTQEDALSILGNITSILTVFLTAIASISLIVGGIGIMNIMLVSVVERTKEIGLRKAIGATQKDILLQFLLEAMMLTVVGGLTGILFGALLTTGVYFVLVNVLPGGWVFALPLQAVGLAVLVSGLTGIVFGIYPARQASRKNPIDALRYE
ncbi:MAG TPA: ABC transporter permease [Candidatus Paceibacterota bacterium]